MYTEKKQFKELNEVYRKVELYDKIVESNSKNLVENGGRVNE